MHGGTARQAAHRTRLPLTGHALAGVLPRHNPDLALFGVGEPAAAAAVGVAAAAAAATAAGDAQQVEVMAVLCGAGRERKLKVSVGWEV